MKTRSDDLEILLAVAQHGGFSAAAEALDIQVARVSRAVGKVEQTLGAAIFTRTTRQVALTDEGLKFVTNIKQGLEKIEQAEIDLTHRGSVPEGKLCVDAASPFLFHQIVPLVKGFKQAYPAIDLELTSNEQFVDLIDKKTDIAIRIGKLEDSTLKAKRLGRSPLYIVASPEYLASRQAIQTPGDLVGHDIIGFSDVKILNKWPIDGHETIVPTITASNGETIRKLCIAGNGIACLSGFMIKNDIQAGTLINLLETFVNHNSDSNSDREYINAVYYASSTKAKRIAAFLEYIKPKLTLD